MKSKFALALLIFIFLSSHAFPENSEGKATFRLFDGGWAITEGPLTGFIVLLGRHGYSRTPFVLLGPGSTRALRQGKIKVPKDGRIGGKIKGTFDGGLEAPVDAAGDLGLTQRGKFNFEITPDSLYKFAGDISGSDGQRFSITARAGDLTYQSAKFVLDIEPTKHKVFKVGETVTFFVNAELRGLAGTRPDQPELQVTLNNEITEVTVESIKNIESCYASSIHTPNQVGCSMVILGPRQTEAIIKVSAVVPDALAGKRLVAVVSVDDGPDYNPVDEIHPIIVSAAIRKASVKVKKASAADPTPTPAPTAIPAVPFTGRWQSSTSGAIIYFSSDSDPNVQSGFLNCTIPQALVARGYADSEMVVRNLVRGTNGVYSGEFKDRAGAGDNFVWTSFSVTPAGEYLYTGSDGANYTPASNAC